MSDNNPTRPNGPAEGGPANGTSRTAKDPGTADQHDPRTAPPTDSEPQAQATPRAPTGFDDPADFDPGIDAGADIGAVLAAEVETLQSQIADLTDRLLRSHADLDNVRKRAEREKQDTARYAISSFAKDTVGLVDNFERAMQAVDPAAVEADPHLKALLDGVAMTEREFLNVLERHGVKRVTPKGQPFDPRLHQAVMERQDASVASGTVVEVFQSGYTIEERCLRPAMVVVARGGGKGQPAAEQVKPEPADKAAEETPSDTGPASSETGAEPSTDSDDTASA